MKKVSWGKFSLLGLTLIAASAVTAAILPNNSPAQTNLNGSITQDGTGTARGTCTLSTAAVHADSCNASSQAGAGGSRTSANAQGGTLEGEFQTNLNTTAPGAA